MLFKERLEKNEKIIVIAMLLILAVQSVFSSFYLSPTADELKHIVRGYTYIKTGDQRFVSVHPLLVNSITAIPLLAAKGIVLPLWDESWKNNSVIDFAFVFFFHSGNDPEEIFSLARIPTFILSACLGFLVYLWARKLYGGLAGIFALFLYVFSVNVLAYSSLVTNDVGGVFFIFLSMFCVWRFYRNPSVWSLVLSGFIFGLALMSKYFSLHFVPSVIALLLLAFFRNREKLNILGFKKKIALNTAGALFIIFLFFFAAWGVLNLGYKFSGTFSSIEHNIENDPGLDKEMYYSMVAKSSSVLPFDDETSKKTVGFLTSKVPIMVPYHYLKGILFSAEMTLERSSEEFYFFEKIYDKPPRYYYIVMFFLKVQIALLAFILLTCFFYRKIAGKSHFDDYFFIIPIFIFAVLFSLNPIANGFRHFLVIFPFIFVFVGKLADFMIENKLHFQIIFYLLAAWYALSALIAFPFYIPYYNEFVGMDNGYKVSINVDVDWGQDLKLLKEYMDENGIKKVSFSYFGQFYPEYYNISYDYLPSIGTARYKGNDTRLNEIENCSKVNGIVAISIANLKQPFLFKNQSCFEWLKDLEPIGRAGYSIYLFNTTGGSVQNIG